MKRTILISALLLCLAPVSKAQEVSEAQDIAKAQEVSKAQDAAGVSADGVKIERNGRYLTVDMTLDLTGLKVGGKRAVLITPRLVNGEHSMDLPSVGVYGRNRYYHYLRNGEHMLTGEEEISYKASDKPANLPYNKVFAYEEWMNGADLTLHCSEYGCCGKMLADNPAIRVGDYAEAVTFFPQQVYGRPVANIKKSRSLEGSAYIDFPVNQTVIYPDYHRNSAELGKIRGTIDSVRNDSDITITQVWLKGYASPESPYAHNTKLAIGRTAALKEYIDRLYHFEDGVIVTDYEPEDWAGLRRYVEQSNIDHKYEILTIIDSDREPDKKEWALKSTYPEEYRFLLRECYPLLRHTDYRIAYIIRDYSDIDEIERLLHTQPQKLSLNEFYLLAQKYEPGSEEFSEVYETAVRMYPADETANLNAANAAMRRGDNARAERYLAKAGNSPEAVYARGALAIRNEDYETAKRYLEQAKEAGVKEAAATLEELANGRRK